MIVCARCFFFLFFYILSICLSTFLYLNFIWNVKSAYESVSISIHGLWFEDGDWDIHNKSFLMQSKSN